MHKLLVLLAVVSCKGDDKKPAPPADDSRSAEVAITGFEALWHAGRDEKAIGSLLDAEFRRPMPSGEIWDRDKQVAWLKDHPTPPGMDATIVSQDLRFYGGVAVASGVAAIFDGAGSELDRTIFTDVYVKRADRWKLVNAQRGAVQKKQ